MQIDFFLFSQAVILAVQQAVRAGIERLRIYTDSRLVFDGATMWMDRWKVGQECY